MIRYRCPHCAALIVAHERRAGQSSVCKACVRPHPIPADPALWLNERSEPFGAPAAPQAPPPEPLPVPVVSTEPVRPASVPDLLLPEPIRVEPPRVEPPSPPPAVPAIVVVREPEPVVAPVEQVERVEPVTIATLTPPPAPAPELPSRRALLPAPATPASRTPERFAPAPTPMPGSVRADPVQLQTQADIAAALTTALTNWMKPPAPPRRDLRPSTAAWMLLTAIGVTLTALALFSDTDYRWAALAAGAVQVVIGYVWIVRLTKARDPVRGALCLVPPLTVYYLAQYKYAKWRPLRFVATGAVLAALAGATPNLAPHTLALVRRSDAPVVPPDPATLSKLEQLRAFREQRSYDALSRLLEELAKTDRQMSADAKDRAELAGELRNLCGHPDTGVRVRAMAAYAQWEPAGARAVCLAAVRSPSSDEREWALRLLPQWKDAESARAVQSLIGRPGTPESNRAKAALEEIGGPPAEQAALALLNRAEDQGTKLTALSILEKVGGAETAGWLRSSYAAASDSPVVRDRALAAAETIRARLRVPAP